VSDAREVLSHWSRLWDEDEVRLFWYVVPPLTVHESVLTIQRALRAPALFSSMPLDWLHITVVLTTAAIDGADALLAAAREPVSKITPFVVTPRVEVWSESVVCASPDNSGSGGWSALRDALADASEPFTRRSAVFIPHMSVAYAHDAGDATPVRSRMTEVAAPPPWTVESVWLLAVRQRPGPAQGWYDWNALGEVRLGDGLGDGSR
jgi:2'-5' RNA ligase